MDSQYLLIQPAADCFQLIDHRPDVPDMTVFTGSQADCMAQAARITSGIGWESIPVYVVQPDRTWKAIS